MLNSKEKRTPFLGNRCLRDGSVTMDKLADDVREAIENASQAIDTLQERIDGAATTTENEYPLTTGRYYNTNGANVGSVWNYSSSAGSNYASKVPTVKAGVKYRIYGYAGTSGATCQYVLMDSNKKVLYKKTGTVNSRTTPTEVIPEQDGIMVVNFQNYNAETDKLVRMETSIEGGMEHEIDDIDSRVTALEMQGKPLAGKTIVCFGDSLTQFTGDIDNKRWTDFFQDITGATVINVGIGGTRLCQRRYNSSVITNPEADGYTNVMNIYSALDVVNMVRAACGMSFNENFTYLQLAQQFVQNTGDAGKVAAVARLDEIDWSNVDAVFIMAGVNDWNGNNASGSGSHGATGSKVATTTLGAVNVIIESLLTTYPNLSIFWATEYPVYHGDTRSTEYYGDNCQVNSMTQRQQSETIKTEVELNHIPVCDLYNTLGWNEYNFSQYFRTNDHVHAYKGFRQIAEKIAAFIIANKNF